MQSPFDDAIIIHDNHEITTIVKDASKAEFEFFAIENPLFHHTANASLGLGKDQVTYELYCFPTEWIADDPDAEQTVYMANVTVKLATADQKQGLEVSWSNDVPDDLSRHSLNQALIERLNNPQNEGDITLSDLMKDAKKRQHDHVISHLVRFMPMDQLADLWNEMCCSQTSDKYRECDQIKPNNVFTLRSYFDNENAFLNFLTNHKDYSTNDDFVMYGQNPPETIHSHRYSDQLVDFDALAEYQITKNAKLGEVKSMEGATISSNLDENPTRRYPSLASYITSTKNAREEQQTLKEQSQEQAKGRGR